MQTASKFLNEIQEFLAAKKQESKLIARRKKQERLELKLQGKMKVWLVYRDDQLNNSYYELYGVCMSEESAKKLCLSRRNKYECWYYDEKEISFVKKDDIQKGESNGYRNLL